MFCFFGCVLALLDLDLLGSQRTLIFLFSFPLKFMSLPKIGNSRIVVYETKPCGVLLY